MSLLVLTISSFLTVSFCSQLGSNVKLLGPDAPDVLGRIVPTHPHQPYRWRWSVDILDVLLVDGVIAFVDLAAPYFVMALGVTHHRVHVPVLRSCSPPSSPTSAATAAYTDLVTIVQQYSFV
jgi:hypothetical protein